MKPTTSKFAAADRWPLSSWPSVASQTRLSIEEVARLGERMRAVLSDHADAYPHALERGFPHVLARIVGLWGSPELDAYFQSLMVSDRPNRQGFPADAATEIFRLSMIHGMLGLTQGPADAGWLGVANRDIERWRQNKK